MAIKNNKKGIALVYVMLVGVSAVVLLSAVFFSLGLGAANTKRSERERKAYLNAKSGAEYSMACIQRDLYLNRFPQENFYVYGDINNLSYMRETKVEEDGLNGEDYDIYAYADIGTRSYESVGQDVLANVQIEIAAVGRYGSAPPYTFLYHTSIQGQYSQVFPASPENTEELAVYTEDEAGWFSIYHKGAVLETNPDIAYVKGTAVFPYETLVQSNGSHNRPYMADQIWFTDDNLSIYFSSGRKDITMAANLFVFLGDVEIDTEEKSKFIIKPCDDNLDSRFAPLVSGQALGDYGYSDVLSFENYGLVYFGAGVSVDGENLGGSSGQFYFFPEDLNLAYTEFRNPYYGREQLVPVDRYDVFNLFSDQVGLSFGEPESLEIGGAAR